MQSKWQARNSQYNTYSTPELSLAAAVLQARGQTALWDDWQKEAAFASVDDFRFIDPLLLQDMDKAMDLLLPLITCKKPLMLHGDYDTDGISATAILYLFLSKLDVPLSYFIPERLEDGYGLSENGVNVALERRPAALITVDCGVQSFREVEQLQAAGIPVVITDHHSCSDHLPAAVAVINPNRSDDKSGLGYLAGAGVALKLTQALSNALGRPDLWMETLDLAAVGTLGDMMPLVGENRRIVKAALLQAGKGLRPGLKALLDLLGLDQQPLNAHTLAYSISPRLNACGRMGQTDTAIQLLLCQDMMEAKQYAAQIEELNAQRKNCEAELRAAALHQLKCKPDLLQSGILVLAGDAWHQGVIGIAAAQLAERFARPCIILTRLDGEDKYRGSARSSGGIDVLSYIQKCRAHLLKCGGHKLACGLELAGGELEAFRICLADVSSELLLRRQGQNECYDLELTAEQLCLPNAVDLHLLEPYGNDHAEPVFLTRKILLSEMRAVGQDKSHLRIGVRTKYDDPDSQIFGIFFAAGHLSRSLDRSRPITLVYRLRVSYFRQRQQAELLLLDLWQEAADAKDTDVKNADIKNTESKEISRNNLKESDVQMLEELYQLKPALSMARVAAPFALDTNVLIPGKTALSAMYLNLKASDLEEGPRLFYLDELAEALPDEAVDCRALKAFIARRVLDIYHEAGLIWLSYMQSEGSEQTDLCVCNLQILDHKVNLYDTPTYRRLTADREREEGGEPRDLL